jgi:hypothetical protein
MVKQSLKFMMAATLLVVSGSFAKADTYSITSDWTTGSAANNNLDTFTGVGLFTWDGTTVTGANFALPTGFTNISFTFTETSIETCTHPFTQPCVQSPTNTVLWTASSTDGAFDTFQPPSPHGTLDLGNGTFDCAGANCVTIALSAPLTTGSPLTVTGISGTSAPNTTFKDATITDVTHQATNQGSLPEPSAVGLLCTVSGLLGVVIFRRRKLAF